MTIRLDAVRTLVQNFKDSCRLAVPLICLARLLSDRPIDWFYFWIGWKFLWSSSTYILGEQHSYDASDIFDKTNYIEKEVHDRCYQSSTRLCTATKSSSTNEATRIVLTALPSVLLCNVACYLYPRDLLNLDTILRTSRQTRQHYEESVGHNAWKCLWYRDYGDVLLKWNVSREAFRRSLRKPLHNSTEFLEFDNNNKHSNSDPNGWLEEQLSQRLDEITKTSLPTTMKDFYFTFGECYIDYVLARKNTINECYLGLHGHIFDFTHFAEYHPGLIEPILKECGGDATFYFEDVPHSSVARNVARRLCVVVDHSVIACKGNNDGDSSSSGCCGLELVLDDDLSNLKKVLRSSNTRPPPLTGEQKRKMLWMAHILPRRPELRRHPTLERIRTRFRREQLRHKRQQNFFRINQGVDTDGSQSMVISSFVTMTTELISSCSPFRKQQDSMSRLYYDPLGQEWVRW